MKKTTYILLGTIATILILLFLFPLFLNMMNKSNRDYLEELNIEGKSYVDKKYQNIKAVKFINNSEPYGLIQCLSTITPCDSNITTVSLPDSKYFTSSQKGDTLIVTLDIKIDKLYSRISDIKMISLKISTPHNLNYISSYANFNVNMQKMNGDSIAMDINNSIVELNNTTFHTISLKGWSSTLYANESTIDSLYIDNDNNITWTMNNCKIDTEFITGSNYMDFTKEDCQKIIWIPKGDKSQIVVGGDKKVIINPDK